MSQTIKPPLPTRALKNSRALRGSCTDAERKLWQHLRAGQMDGLKFRRQHSIPPYIVDFCCLSKRLIVELDGAQHGAEADVVRTRFLESRGFTLLRFWDNEVLVHTDAVAEAIWNHIGYRTLTPTPLPAGEGL